MPTHRDESPSSSSAPWQRLPTAATWQDLVLAEPALAQLRRLAAAARARRRERPIELEAAPEIRRDGLAALFAGPRGTGKTLAAQVLAHELGWDLYRVDLAAAVDNDFGETEKSLRGLFDVVEPGAAILLLDEADALFGKRSAVRDAHDRYSGIDVAYLLQRIGEFEGLVILASHFELNLEANPASNPETGLHPALLRRMEAIVAFSRPVAAVRAHPLPPGARLSSGVYLSPGVYVEELPPRERTIAGVATSIAAFVGRTASGPTDAPTLVSSFAEFEQAYGGLALDSPLSYAVRHFFDQGGGGAVVARVAHRDAGGAEDTATPITDADLADPSLAPLHRGLRLLDRADRFNLLCIPPLSRTADVGAAAWDAAIRYAGSRRAFVIVDPPAGWTSAAAALGALSDTVPRDANAALYFPRLLAADPLTGSSGEAFAPCGAIAGIYARTDAQRGVWKAPAGPGATLSGVTGLTTLVSEAESEALNRKAINCLRIFARGGPVVWGARTLQGADALASDWKYVPVRRLALFIEESLDRGTRWAVFEPNDEPLWAHLRLGAGNFLLGLWRQGALLGTTPNEAYFVQCGRETTSQAELDQGIVHLVVGFAPLKPAEFVVLRVSLRAAAPES